MPTSSPSGDDHRIVAPCGSCHQLGPPGYPISHEDLPISVASTKGGWAGRCREPDPPGGADTPLGKPQNAGRLIGSRHQSTDVGRFTGGLNWYRALHEDWAEGLGHDFRCDKPALMICAADDWFLRPDFTEGVEELLPRLEKHVIPDAAFQYL